MKIEVIGKQFGKWTILELGKPDSRGKTRYLCKCECGSLNDIHLSGLRLGKTTQCRQCKWRYTGPEIVGTKMGKWSVLAFNPENRLYECLCECFAIHWRKRRDLVTAKSTQCEACYHRNRIAYNRRHGLSYSNVYRVWSLMKERCSNPNNKDYKYYGGRGIKVSEPWLIFDNFYADMGTPPKGMQLDRIDNNSGYSKENCRWVTPKENSANRRKKGTACEG